KTCSALACTCSGNGGAQQSTETACADLADNDCDGVADCADSDCDGKQCSQGGTCSNGMCLCAAAGNLPETIETHCSDGLDNDCDGKSDCVDAACDTHTCKPNGYVCMGLVCACTGNGGMPQANGELSCTDGFDNDCDGLIDCADPSCDGAA